MIQASVVNNADIILTLEDHHADALFAGYQLERKSDSVDWMPWTGSAWGGSAATLASNRFTDYGIPAGLYQYRFRVVFDDGAGTITYSDYESTSWNRIASSSTEKRGWSFENYEPPPGEFGEILTADDMRFTYLWGVPFTSSGGAQYTDAQIRDMIRKTVAEFEHVLNLTIVKRVIKCRDDYSAGDYDELEDAYAYHRRNWNAGGRLNTRRRPILSVERFELYTITMGKIVDLFPWLRVDHKKGVLHFYPKANVNGVIKVFPAFLSYGYLAQPDYEHAYRLDYTAGYEDASKVEEDLRDVIGKATACRLLNIIGDGLIAGFANMSLSMDGLSEGFGTTASATNALYGARINQYLKEIETWLKQNMGKFGQRVMGAI